MRIDKKPVFMPLFGDAFDASQQQNWLAHVNKCLVFFATPFHNPTP
jgi:hypothetical protein